MLIDSHLKKKTKIFFQNFIFHLYLLKSFFFQKNKNFTGKNLN